MADVYLRILLSAQQGNTMSVIRNVTSALGGPGGGLGGALLGVGGLAAGAAIVVTGAAVAMGAASVKAAGDYQQAMNMVQSLTGSSTKQMAQYDQGLKQLAVDAGVAPTQLASGLYNVLSASYRGADAMRVLTLATEDAKIGMTDASVTTDALTNVLRSFNVQSKDITAVNGEMLQTVTLGKSTFQQYASTIVKASSSANQFHVSMETMNAAWSTLTSSGIKAAQASTDFQQSLKVMYGNIGTVTSSLQKSGIAFDESKFNAMSYGDKVVYLNQALEQANAKHVKVTGVTLQAAQAISTISAHIGDYNKNLATLSDKTAMANKTQQAWAITQQGFNQQMSRLSAAFDVVKIKIGNALLPILGQLLGWVTPLVTGFADWIDKSNILGKATDWFKGVVKDLQPIFKDILADVAPLVRSFQDWASKNDVAGKAGQGLHDIIVGIALAIKDATPTIISVIKWVVQFGQEVGERLSPIIQKLTTLIITYWPQIKQIAVGVWQEIAGSVKIAWSVIKGVVEMAMDLVNGDWGKLWQDFLTMVTGVWDGVKEVVQGQLAIITAFFGTTWDNVKQNTQTAWGSFTSWLQGAWQNIINFFKQTGQNLLNTVMAPIYGIVDGFKWMYDHNYYFKNTVDFIKNIFTTGFTWLRTNWTSFTTWLAGIWKSISDAASTVWGKVSGFVTSAFSKVKDAVGGFWKNDLKPKFDAVWTSISGWFTNLVSSAGTWGSNMIKGFINGISSQGSNIASAGNGVVSQIANWLGFHSPTKLGPGRDLLKWGQNMVKGFAQGVQQGLPTLDAQMNITANHVASPLSSPASLQGNGGGHTFVFNINASGVIGNKQEITQWMLKEISGKLRQSGVFTSMTSGGKSTF